MTFPHDPITPAAFLVAAAAVAQALGRPITNAAEAHGHAVAEALVLDQFDSPVFGLVEALAFKEELERLVGHLQFSKGSYDVRLDFDSLAELADCAVTARQAALRAGFWPTPCGDKVVWANFSDVSDSRAAPSLWLTFAGLQWIDRALTNA